MMLLYSLGAMTNENNIKFYMNYLCLTDFTPVQIILLYKWNFCFSYNHLLTLSTFRFFSPSYCVYLHFRHSNLVIFCRLFWPLRLYCSVHGNIHIYECKWKHGSKEITKNAKCWDPVRVDVYKRQTMDTHNKL